MMYCVMADCQISEEVCSKEQNTRNCRGCRASSRRCTKCGEVGVVDAEHGRCGACAVPGSRRKKQDEEDSSCSDGVLSGERIMQLLHTAQAVSPLIRISVSKSHQDHLESMRTTSGEEERSESDVAEIIQILLEHARELSDGSLFVTAPVPTLCARIELSNEEAKRALDAVYAHDCRLLFCYSCENSFLHFPSSYAEMYRQARMRIEEKSDVRSDWMAVRDVNVRRVFGSSNPPSVDCALLKMPHPEALSVHAQTERDKRASSIEKSKKQNGKKHRKFVEPFISRTLESKPIRIKLVSTVGDTLPHVADEGSTSFDCVANAGYQSARKELAKPNIPDAEFEESVLATGMVTQAVPAFVVASSASCRDASSWPTLDSAEVARRAIQSLNEAVSGLTRKLIGAKSDT